MDPAIDSTRLKYIAKCLMNVNKDAAAQLGEDMMYSIDPIRSTMLTIENIEKGPVIATQPFTTSAETLGRGLNRFKGSISFTEDGSSHSIGADVTVCHKNYVPSEYCRMTDGLKKLIGNVQSYRASVDAKTIQVLASQDLKDDPVIYIKNDSEGHYMGILDNIRVKMHGNIVQPGYTMFAAAYLKKLARMAKGDVTVDWGDRAYVKFMWDAYGLRMSYYVAPRFVNDENIIKRLDRKVIL